MRGEASTRRAAGQRGTPVSVTRAGALHVILSHGLWLRVGIGGNLNGFPSGTSSEYINNIMLPSYVNLRAN